MIKNSNITIDSNSSANIVSLIKTQKGCKIINLDESDNLIRIKRGKYKKEL